MRLRLISVLLCASMLITALPFCAFAEGEAFDGEYVDGEIIISSEKEIADVVDFDDAGIVSAEKLETYSEDNVYVAEISGSVERACRKLNRNEGVVAEPNVILQDCAYEIPADGTDVNPLYAQYQKPYLGNIMHIPEAWQENEVSGEGVTIALVDSGFYLDATDFPVNLWKNELGTVGWNVHEDNDDISPIFKSDGKNFEQSGMWATQHGTNIAGAIGMAANLQGGIGAAYGAELMLIKAAAYVDDTSINVSLDDVIEAIDYARVHGADIINFSLSTTSNTYAMLTTINRAYESGVAIISSVANSGKGVSEAKSYPAAYSNVIGVMALDTRNPTQLMDFSNYDDSATQEYYDIAAPGYDIVGCDVIPGSLTRFSGSSQACAFVSSCAALYYEKYPNATVADLYSAIRTYPADTVNPYPRSSTATYKFRSLNALKLLDYCSHREYIETVITEPTCTEEGTMQCVCRVCGDTYTKPIPACHSWGKWETAEHPSADGDGMCIRHCQNCSEYETMSVPNKIINCNVEGNVITGITAGESVSSFKSKCLVNNIYWISVLPNTGIIKTGSKVIAYYTSDGPAVEYEIVIYGDVDGDGWYDGTDSVYVNCIANGLLTKEQIGEAAYKAADCNHDGVVDSADVAILEHAGLVLSSVDQSKSPEELILDSAYQEYLSLIDQNPQDEPVESKSFIQKIIDFIIELFNIVKNIIEKF